MKKVLRAISVVLTLVICLSACAVFTGCASSKIIGTWVDEDGMEITFGKGGKGTMSYSYFGSEQSIEFNWKYKRGILTISRSSDSVLGTTSSEFGVVSLDKNKLVLSPEPGAIGEDVETMTLTKKGAKKTFSLAELQLTGKWVSENDAIEFKSDGTGTRYKDPEFKEVDTAFEWQLNGDELTLTIDCYDYDYEIELEGDELEIYFGYRSTVYTRHNGK